MSGSTRRALAGAVLAFVLAAGAIVVLTSDGYKSTKVDLNDAGIWITKTVASSTPGQPPLSSVGRLNMEVGQVDTKLAAASKPDVLQSGTTMLVQQAGSLTSYDVADPEKDPVTAGVPAEGAVELGGGTVAALDVAKRAVYVVAADQLQGNSFQGKPGIKVQGRASRMAVGTDGVVHVVEDGRVRSYGADGKQRSSHRISIDPSSSVQVSAAGSHPVVLDEDAKRVVVVGGHTTDLSEFDGDLVLQQPSDDDDVVTVAAAGNLIDVAVGSGKATSVFARQGMGKPIEPVRVAGCSYGAWMAPAGRWAAACGTPSPTSDAYGGAHQLRFRVNHHRVTLNDVESGGALIVDAKPPQAVEGAWDSALTVRPEQQAQNPQEGEQRNTTDDKDQDLTAKPIDVAARVGRPRTIPALASAPGALYVSKVSQPQSGTAAVGLNGQTIEYDPGASQPGRSQFSYTVSDGRGHEATSTVTVSLLALDGKNRPPTANPDPITIRPGGTAVVNVLANDDDPDGDGLLLQVATTEDGTLTTPQHRPDGIVSVRAGSSTGQKVVSYTVVDDLGAATTTGQLLIDVKDEAAVVARDDFALGHVGEQMSIRATANDLSPSGPLRIASVTPQGGNAGSLQVRDRSDAEVRFVASAPGAYEVEYTAVDDATGTSDKARIRLQVVAAKGERPTAARDSASVAVDVPVVIPVLANDSDPDGDVLALTGVDPGSRDALREAGVDVEVLKREFLRITVHRAIPLTEPFLFRYGVTDGTTAPVTGAVVLRGLVDQQDHPPIAADDDLTLRPGLVGAVRVLDNDIDPEGGQLTLGLPASAADGTGQGADLPCTTRQGDPCPPGTAFVQGDLVRVVAPPEPGSFDITYTALDPGLNRGGAVLHVDVVDRKDQPPLPPLLEVRTSVGKPIPIQIPVIGSDPDGDVVSLVGVASSPRHGTLPEIDDDGYVLDADGDRAKVPDGIRKGEDIQVPANGLWYVPATPGSDEFTYTVRDREGLEGRGTVRVAVVPNTTNSPPVAVPDHLEAVPGKTLEADVLANDSDPDGDELTLVPEASKGRPGVREVRAASGVILVRVIGKDGDQIAIPYRVQDALGQTAESTLIIDVKAGTRGSPPVAVDDVLPATKPGDRVVARILENDTDPDGLLSAGRVELAAPPGLGARFNGVQLTFRMPKEPVQFRYTVFDKDRNSASAFVVVPVLRESGLRTKADTATVKPGEPITIDVVANDLPRGDVELEGITQDGTAGHAKPDGSGRVSYTPNADGTATVDGFSYKVHQRSDPTKTAEGAVSITIERSENHPPVLSGVEVEVAAGGKATIDLNKAVTDPDRGDTFRFEKVGADPAPSVHAGLDHSILTIEAAKDAYSKTKGQVAPVQIKVTDSGEKPQSAQAQVRVVLRATQTPPPVVNNDRFDVVSSKGDQTWDVLGNDVGSGLELASVEQPPDGQGRTSMAGDRVVYSPPRDDEKGFAGTTTFTYHVKDDSGEDSHLVVGTVTVNVVGRPTAPTNVQGEAGSKQVSLRWSDALGRGAPVQSYKVTGSGFAGQSCSSSPCTITGLTNGSTYRFQVVAVASFAGTPLESAPSAPSPDFRPNKIPDPSTFVASADDAGDKAITVHWTDATTSEGTAITGYKLQLSPADSPQSAQNPGAGTHQATFTGLKNGTSYQVTLIAKNAQGESDPSQSQPIVPYGKPLFSGGAKPTGTAGDSQINVSWPAADANGSPITKYTLAVTGDGTKTQDLGPSVTSTVVQNLKNGTGYTFKVTATNARGESDPTASSEPTTASGKPFPIAGVTAQEGDQQVTLTFTAPDNNGSAITTYQVTGNGTVSKTGAASGPVTITMTGLTNGTSYTFGVAACNTNPTSTKCGTPTNANAVVPYGKPGTPSVSSNGTRPQGDRHLTWNWNLPNANGRAITGFLVQLDGGGQQSVGAGTTSWAIDAGYGETHTLYVWAVNAPGSQSASPGSATATAGAAPPPPPSNPSVRAKYTGDSFDTAGAGGHMVDNDVSAGQTYAISGACYRGGDIGSNNGWWYRLEKNGRWAAGTLFDDRANGFGATRVAGGGGCT